MKRILLTMFPIVFVLIGINLVISGMEVIRQARESTHWPATKGVITFSEINAVKVHTNYASDSEEQKRYAAIVKYKYTVRNDTYIAQNISFGNAGDGTAERANEIIRRYEKGKAVAVYYNPIKPELSVLEPGVSKKLYFTLILGAIIIFLGFMMIIAFIRNRRRINQSIKRFRMKQ